MIPDKSLQVIMPSREETFASFSLLIACFCSVESLLWEKEDVYDAELDSCEMAEAVFEEGLDYGAEYAYDPQRLFSNYPLSVQYHLSKCLRCQSRLLEITQRYHRTWFSQSMPAFDKIIAKYRADLKIYPLAEFTAYHAALQNNLGNVLLSRFEQHGQEGDLQQAIVCYETAGRCYKPNLEPLTRATILNNLANALQKYARLHNQPDQLEQAVTYYQKALKLFKEQDCHVHQALVHNNLGTAQLQRFETSKQADTLQQALFHYQIALETCQAPHYLTHYALVRRNQGAALFAQYNYNKRVNDWEQAFTCYQKALEFFDQSEQFAYDATLTTHALTHLERSRIRQPRLTTEITYIDNAELGDPASLYQPSKTYELGVIRLAGVLEARATISWSLKTKGAQPKMSFNTDGSVVMDGWKIYVRLQPLLVRSNRLRLSLTLPDTQSQPQFRVSQDNLAYDKWTSPWYGVEQTDPIEIEIPNFWHLSKCHELHWQIEETPLPTATEWLSSYLSWDSLLEKLANHQRHFDWYGSNQSFGPLVQDQPESYPELTQEPETDSPKAYFDMINLIEPGIKLQVEGQQLWNDRIRLTLHLLSNGVATDKYDEHLHQAYELSLTDHNQQTLLPPTRLKIGYDQVVDLNTPTETLAEWSSLEFKLRMAYV